MALAHSIIKGINVGLKLFKISVYTNLCIILGKLQASFKIVVPVIVFS